MAIRKAREQKIQPDTAMADVLTCHPEVIEVMIRHRMLCVGCPLVAFHDIRDAALEYDLDPDQLYREILNAPGKSRTR